MFRRHNTRPNVKKVSTLVDKRSHKQRKYISLMFVPSYSSGRTRSLRIPRVVFYCIIFTILTVASVTTWLYLRSERYADQYRYTRDHLYDTQVQFDEYQVQSAEVQAQLEEELQYTEDQLTEEQRQAQMELHNLEQQHRHSMYDLQQTFGSYIEELEQRLREFDYEWQAIIEGLSSRTIIPPVAALFDSMTQAQAALMYDSVLSDLPPLSAGYAAIQPAQASIGFVSFADAYVQPLSEEILSERIAILSAEFEIRMLLMENLQYYRAQMEPHIRNFPTLWPISGQISSHFGWRRNPMGGRGSEFHSGIDIRAPRNTPIRAAGGGTVTSVGWQGGYGLTVVINHGNGLSTLYAHNSVNLVSVGQRVERGDIIARVGTTGRTTGPHVHFEVLENGVAVNPRPFMLEHY